MVINYPDTVFFIEWFILFYWTEILTLPYTELLHMCRGISWFSILIYYSIHLYTKTVLYSNYSTYVLLGGKMNESIPLIPHSHLLWLTLVLYSVSFCFNLGYRNLVKNHVNFTKVTFAQIILVWEEIFYFFKILVYLSIIFCQSYNKVFFFNFSLYVLHFSFISSWCFVLLLIGF